MAKKMANKAPVKKSRRRLKRSVRRSLAAVLMITAIGVAAIPVPENYAAPEGITPYAEGDPILPYSYPIDENKNSTLRDFITNPDLESDGQRTKLAYTINALSDGSYQMDWQFSFYPIAMDKNVARGIINEYNSTYAQERVTLNPNVTCDYKIVENQTFSDFFDQDRHTGSVPFTYTCTNPADADSTVVKFFTDYFASEYQSYQNTTYRAYQEELARWQAQHPDGIGDDKPTEPSFTKTLADLTTDQKYVFYCDYAENGDYAGCKLALVIDSSRTDTTVSENDPNYGTNVRVYIPQRRDGGNPSSSLMFDSQGFVYETDASIIGIGNEAFKNTRNVLYLTVPQEIKYIGVSAFEDSFLKEIDLVNVEQICDKAFKNCSDLTQVTFRAGTTEIGTESFYGTGITEISFPSTMSKIGPGAFADCEFLQKIDFSGITGSNIEIWEYAFYNALGLNEVNVMRSGSTEVTVGITTLGKCAFAVDGIVTGNMTDFRFPTAISAQASETAAEKDRVGLGDYVLAGRSNLLRVIMPGSFGSSVTARVPSGTFYNCYYLEYVRFPDSCGRATYETGDTEETKGKGLFSTISNPDFYVWGPEMDSARNTALPRSTTWDAVTAVSDVVPYRYDRNGQTFYEVSDGTYLLCIDNNGVLTSYTRKDTSREPGPIDLVIPAKVGETEVTGIASNCFSDDVLNQHTRSVTIEDNSQIATINDGVFQNWGALEKVYIGNSVTSIGNNAFKDCTKLIDVTFSTPLSGYEAFTIGTDAFKTQSEELTFHGDIVVGYEPFEWATDPVSSIINERTDLRVCYKSLAPTYLTVMYNPITDMVTLLDYPKYSEIKTLLAEAFADEMAADGFTDYTKWRENTLYYETFGGSAYDSYREKFATAWKAALNAGDEEAVKAAKEAVYADRNTYGPWVNPIFCNGDEDNEYGWNYVPKTESAPDDEFGLGEKISNFFFEPIVAYAAGGDDPEPYYSHEGNSYNVARAGSTNNTDPFYPPMTEERGLVDSTTNIVVPAGVESIDVYGYINNLTVDGEMYTAGSDSNTANYGTYLWKGWDTDSRNMYEKPSSKPDEDGIISVPGLFSGYYEDGASAVQETRYRGNDVIRSVTMYTVKYLPDYAFDSCEGLEYVILGEACSDIGKAPFRGCHSMTTVGDNDYYTTVNGIIYSVNTDGSYTIEECLAKRGNGLGQAVINVSADADLANVSAIKPGAFEDCDYITEVNFGSRDTAGLTVIPEDCFKNCDRLQTVVLPMTVNDVGKGAFVGANNLTGLTVYGKEVNISARAFDGEKDTWTTVRAYEDSAVVRYVKEWGNEYKLRYDDQHPLGEMWQVSFYDYNYTLIEDLKDQLGKDLENPQYVEDGALATLPQNPANTDDWTFEKWVGANNVTLGEAIHEDSFFYAQGYSNSGLVNGKYPVEFYDGVDGKQVGPTQYIDPGSDAIAPGHPVHAGYDADGFSGSYTNIQAPTTIIMKYKAIGGSGNSGTQGTGSNSTNTSDQTSTTSTTSGSGTATGKYTVTVVNGSGSGTYDVGSTVIIAANTAPNGMVFQKWTSESNGVALASVSMSATTFVMPANNVTVTANYVAGTGSTGSSGSGNSRNTGTSGNNGTTDSGNTRVDITKPGISNKDLATAHVNGSMDNFVVKISETDEATRAVADALTNKYGSLENILYYAMDINLYDSTGTTRISDTTGLTVDITIPIPDALVAYGGNNMAGAVINSNQLEDLNESFTTINGVPCIRFTATHFSPYTIYVDTGNLTEGMLDTTPKTGDPIHPKWFLSIGLACLSIILFMKKDKKVKLKTA